MKTPIFKGFYFLCINCGEILTPDMSEIDEITLPIKYLCGCGKMVTMANSYPNIPATNFLRTVDALYSQSIQTDKSNRTDIIACLNEISNMNIDVTTLDGYICLYEDILSSNKWNDASLWCEIGDIFTEKLEQKGLTGKEADTFLAAIKSYWHNDYRTPFVVTLGAFYESLFNDFFKELLIYSLGDKGADILIKEYEYVGIKKCIEFSEKFMQYSLNTTMDEVEKGFCAKWETVKTLRNAIVHSNDKYVTKKKVNELYRMIVNGVNAFAYLRSKIIKGTI